MARLVNCRLLKKELPGLEFPPFPGPDGQSIYDSISKEAWSKWVGHQTTLINEKRLNMMDENARKYFLSIRMPQKRPTPILGNFIFQKMPLFILPIFYA